LQIDDIQAPSDRSWLVRTYSDGTALGHDDGRRPVNAVLDLAKGNGVRKDP